MLINALAGLGWIVCVVASATSFAFALVAIVSGGAIWIRVILLSAAGALFGYAGLAITMQYAVGGAR